MNERIKQLAEQAGALEVKSVLNIPKALSLNGAEIERFAELIVQECIDILEPKSRYMGEGPEVLKDKIRQIKQHFGVEE